jgi:hypothetical protein
MHATDGTWHDAERPIASAGATVDRALIASVGLLGVVALLILARRASGAFDSPLPLVPLVATAIGLLAWAVAVRLYLCDWRINWTVAVIVVVFAIGCSYPGERAIDWLTWLPSLAVFALLPARRSSPAIESDNATGSLLQELIRTRAADGVELIRGKIIAEFAPHERSAVLHVAFAPPFEMLPEVHAECVRGPRCDVKIAQILHQGIRLEVRLQRASTAPRRATIEFSASGRSLAAD